MIDNGERLARWLPVALAQHTELALKLVRSAALQSAQRATDRLGGNAGWALGSQSLAVDLDPIQILPFATTFSTLGSAGGAVNGDGVTGHDRPRHDDVARATRTSRRAFLVRPLRLASSYSVGRQSKGRSKARGRNVIVPVSRRSARGLGGYSWGGRACHRPSGATCGRRYTSLTHIASCSTPTYRSPANGASPLDEQRHLPVG